MADLLLELFSEEIPARMQQDALAHLIEQLEKRIVGAKVKGSVTPRRLTAIATGLAVTQPVIESELKGPKVSAPEAALQGFLKKNNLTQKDLEERDGAYFAKVK